jgi:hypothetical protein
MESESRRGNASHATGDASHELGRIKLGLKVLTWLGFDLQPDQL